MMRTRSAWAGLPRYRRLMSVMNGLCTFITPGIAVAAGCKSLKNNNLGRILLSRIQAGVNV